MQPDACTFWCAGGALHIRHDWAVDLSLHHLRAHQWSSGRHAAKGARLARRIKHECVHQSLMSAATAVWFACKISTSLSCRTCALLMCDHRCHVAVALLCAALCGPDGAAAAEGEAPGAGQPGGGAGPGAAHAGADAAVLPVHRPGAALADQRRARLRWGTRRLADIFARISLACLLHAKQHVPGCGMSPHQ